MKRINPLALFALAALSAPAAAQMPHMPGMAGMQNHPQKTMTHHGSGTVNSVDAKAGTVNLTHGPIKDLGWPGMTMGFPVADPSLLQGIQPGMKVDFELEKTASGYRILRIAPAKE